MKKLIVILLILLNCSFAYGQEQIARMVVGSGSGAAPPSYLLSESFDGSASCAAGYSDTCDNTWTVASGTPDYDYGTSPAPLEGANYSLREDSCTSGADVETYIGFTPTGGQAQEVYLLANFNTLTVTSNRTFIQLATAATARATVYIATSNRLGIVASGGASAYTVGTLSTGTTYHIWIKFLKGTGVDGFASVAFSTDGVRPTSGNNYAESTDGTATVDANRLYIRSDYATSNCTDQIIDKVRIDDATIGDNPS